ncbi:MAG: hypothetical protein ACE5JU_20420 [Candidatus Binatia bacterium]
MLKRSFEWLLEQAKAASDVIIALLLRSSSRFGGELTDEGKREQRMWREQRLRNLKGLALTPRDRRAGRND